MYFTENTIKINKLKNGLVEYCPQFLSYKYSKRLIILK